MLEKVVRIYHKVSVEHWKNWMKCLMIWVPALLTSYQLQDLNLSEPQLPILKKWGIYLPYKVVVTIKMENACDVSKMESA